MIPKRIIQTGPPNLSIFLRAAMVNVKALHPDFEYIFFTDAMIESFLAEHFPQYRTEYETFRYRIQKYDFFRYLAIYKFGGFYLDLDVFLAEDLNPLLSSSCVFAFEELAVSRYFWNRFGMDWQIGNYAFGAEAGDPFVGAIIENCLRAKKDPDWATQMMKGTPSSMKSDFYILNTTGPGLVTRTFAENPHLVEGIKVLFPDDVCDRRTWHQFGTYGVHHMAASWRLPANFFARRMTRVWELWTERRVLNEGEARGKTRSVRVGLNRETNTSI
jgi:hypothetical protein